MHKINLAYFYVFPNFKLSVIVNLYPRAVSFAKWKGRHIVGKKIKTFGTDSNNLKFLLMSKDILILEIDLGTGEANIENEELVPLGMHIERNPHSIREFIRNRDSFNSWCASRVLTLDRKYAKKIYNALGFSQRLQESEKAALARSYRCLSLQDCYWVKRYGDCVRWNEISLFRNSLSEALVPIALRGETFTLQNRELHRMPDVSTDGTYAKAWKRVNGRLVLYKPNDSEDTCEVAREVSASRVLDCFNVNHVKYERTEYDGLDVSECECMTSEERSIVFFYEIKKWCSHHGKDPVEFVTDRDADGYYKMMIANYLIGNVDLHDGNWGMFFHPDTGQLLRVFDLFDFNNAFDPHDYFSLDGGNCIPTTRCINLDTGSDIGDDGQILNLNYQYVPEQTMLEAARAAMNQCSFNQIQDMDRDVFISQKYMEAFQRRCDAIGLQVRYTSQ